jgi:hypothetical protein
VVTSPAEGAFRAPRESLRTPPSWVKCCPPGIDELATVRDPAERLARLIRSALSDETVRGLQPAIMAHAEHPLVRPVLERVTTRRLDFITAAYEELGLAPAAARQRAVIAYATYLGWLDLRRGPADVVPEVTEGDVAAAATDAVLAILLAGVPTAGGNGSRASRR